LMKKPYEGDGLRAQARASACTRASDRTSPVVSALGAGIADDVEHAEESTLKSIGVTKWGGVEIIFLTKARASVNLKVGWKKKGSKVENLRISRNNRKEKKPVLSGRQLSMPQGDRPQTIPLSRKDKTSENGN